MNFRNLFVLLSFVFSTTFVFDVQCQSAASKDEMTYTEIILDASGSMLGEINGVSKISTAKLMLGHFIKGVEKENHLIALRTFGARNGNCKDISLKMDFYAKDASSVLEVVGDISPKNQAKTPLASAMEEAFKHLKTKKGKRNLIVFTDGKETCGKDPCKIAKKIQKEIQTKIYLIAFGVNKVKDFKELKCVVDETDPDGLAINSNSPEALAEALANVRKKINQNSQGLIIKGPDPTAQAVATSIDGKQGFDFLASMGTDLPVGKYNVVVQYRKPFRFQNVEIKKGQLKVLNVTGLTTISQSFFHEDMETEAVNADSGMKYLIKSLDPIQVPPGNYNIVAKTKSGVAFQWPKQLLTPDDTIKLSVPPFGILNYSTDSQQPIRIYRKQNQGMGAATLDSTSIKKIIAEKDADFTGVSNRDIVLEEGFYTLVFANGAVHDNVKITKGKLLELPVED